jgi:DNA invertase Pin-like site-specific DNA recombinase
MHRAIGITRVSRVGDRQGDRFVSPDEQAARIEAFCKRENLNLVAVLEELDVSGGAPLHKRPGLRQAVEAIENRQAEVVVVAYFDRLVRSLKVMQEVVERVEAAGGRIATADLGTLSNGTAAQWFSSALMGAAAEYVRRSIGERARENQLIALELGRWPVNVIPGLRRNDAGLIELDPDTCAAVGEAFRLRAKGARIADVRAHLAEHGIVRSYHGTQSLLTSRQAIGEITFGEHAGTIPALIDRRTWDRVQRMVIQRGRKGKSDRLLARLGVLRCATCNSRMIASTQTQHGRRYPFYRCGVVRADCPDRPSISAEYVEGLVVDEVKRLLAGIQGAASGDDDVQDAAAEFDRAQAALDGAIRAFTGLEAEQSAAERLSELREARDLARERFEQLDADHHAVDLAVTVGDWDELSWDGRRKLIKAVIDRVIVRPGRGPGRVTIEAKAAR